MKLLFTSIVVIFVLCLNAGAQSDNLVIKLKNNQIDTISVSQIQKIQFENITSVQQKSSENSDLRLVGNFPNPSKGNTSIEFEITYSGNVAVNIFDNTGKLIRILKCENCISGKNVILWDCLDINNIPVQSGVYYYEVRFANEVQSRKMLLVK